ncbi:MAG: hypothetical protein DRJ13_05250 [Bacteroidetes bacterium]|nr:MAG: hypothetical protein DRJ13_05250 [Bacteroidota bacterium]
MIFARNRSQGQGILEYVLIISLIPIAILLIMNITGVSVRDAYCSVMNIFGSKVCHESYFSDEFDNLDQWQIMYGNWKINDGRLCNQRSGAIFAEIPQGDDYQITLKGANLTRGNGYGIMFRSTNFEKDNSYIFQYDPGYSGGEMIFRERANRREFRPFARYDPGNTFNWKTESHDIKLIVQEDTFTAYIDSEQILQTRDNTWTEGGIGLRTWDNTEVCFDSITVDPLP